MSSSIQGKVCRFCGLSTDVPHETQQGCIDALHAEITRTRDLLETVKLVSENNAENGESHPNPRSDLAQR
jgi:hypothetical protein